MLLLPVDPGQGEAFDRFVGTHVHGDPLQGSCFGEVQTALGRTSHRFYLVEQSRTVGALSLIAAEVGRLGARLVLQRAIDEEVAACDRQTERTYP